MRKLNSVEIESVSGAWIFSDIGSSLGFVVGSIINKGASDGGITIDSTTASAQIGSGLGKIIELNLSGAISDLGKGIVGWLAIASSAKDQASA
ncbi:hypothetical protein EHW64_14975 [Erwinia psidii]|uniref:hypothetical protein n=1 Tax=Erwinia psidii TaxID=69224 RepID=UPI00226B87F3|nr:hypothetical protein [Erwinia psidii]MCX8962400.1 hypothetical protein [Erwinia psidii]